MTCTHWTAPGNGTAVAGPAICPWCQVEQLRGELSLADDGLANYQQEVAQLTASLSTAVAHYERLRKILTQAPIAKVIIRDDGPADVVIYAPGLPLGEFDLYLQTEEIPGPHPTPVIDSVTGNE